MSFRHIFLALTLISAVSVHAEEASVTAVETRPTPSDAKVLLSMELRPSFSLKEGHSENFFSGGYRWSKDNQITYKQEWSTNISDPSGKITGLAPYTYDGSFRVKTKNIWTSGRFSLDNEARVYLPTHEYKRIAGQVVTLRDHVKLSYRASDSTSVFVEEVPFSHLYSQPGILRSSGEEANPVWENRLAVGVEVSVLKNLKLVVPITLNSVRYADYKGGAKNNNSWGHKLWMWPELMYAYNENVSFGLAYYSDNFIKSDFSGLTINDGFSKGVAQFIVAASI